MGGELAMIIQPQLLDFTKPRPSWGASRRGFLHFGKKPGRQDIRRGSQTINVFPGEDIQATIDSISAGTIFLKAGTHKPGNNYIDGKSNVTIKGEATGATIVDFENNPAGFRFVGSNSHSAGTVSISNGGVAITGVSTAFTSAMVGRDILLDGIWYPISSFTNATSISIGLPYASETLSGASYRIATTIESPKIFDLTIKNSAVAGIKAQYSNEFFLNDVQVQQCTVGLDIDDSSNVGIDEYDGVLNTDDIQIDNTYLFYLHSVGGIDTTNHGLALTDCKYADLRAIFMENCGGAGYKFTRCSDIGKKTLLAISCGADGFEYVSGNTYMVLQASEARACALRGIKVTDSTDYCTFLGVQLINNLGTSMAILNANCDKNEYDHIVAVGNGVDAVENLGTATTAGTVRT